jgi:nucleoside recognition membrane protein YjiH
MTRFILSVIVGIGFLLFPFQWGPKTSVAFDHLTGLIIKEGGWWTEAWAFVLILFGALVSLVSQFKSKKKKTWMAFFQDGIFSLLLRIGGLVLASVFFFKFSWPWLAEASIRGMMWNTLIVSVSVVIPLGAVILNLFSSYGALDFTGTLMRPIMKPLFRLPGRSALDDLLSWLGPYSVGLYMTQQLFRKGFYNRREAFAIATCFSTVSIGFVGVVANTLKIFHLFPLLFASYFFCVYLLAAILARVWPTTRIPTSYINDPHPEPTQKVSFKALFKAAYRQALARARAASHPWLVAKEALRDGVLLASSIVGIILVVGTIAMFLAQKTPVFNYLGAPLIPLLKGLGIPNAGKVGPALISGIAEVYIPSLLVVDTQIKARFFVALVSISQIIFFSSVAPMMLTMFREIPIRLRDLLALFFMRTALLIPIAAGIVWVAGRAGWL